MYRNAALHLQDVPAVETSASIDQRVWEHLTAADRHTARAEAYAAGQRVNEYGMALDAGDFRAMLENAETELVMAFSWLAQGKCAPQRAKTAGLVRDRFYAVRAAA